MIASGTMDVIIASGCELAANGIASDMNCTLASNGQNAGHPSQNYLDRYGIPNQMTAAQDISGPLKITKEGTQDFAVANAKRPS